MKRKEILKRRRSSYFKKHKELPNIKLFMSSSKLEKIYKELIDEFILPETRL